MKEVYKKGNEGEKREKAETKESEGKGQGT